MKPLINEGDYIYFLERDKRTNKVYVVDKTEDLVVDKTYPVACTAAAISNFTQIDELEPKQVSEPEIQLYQIRAGIDVGMAYTEMLAGSIRRTPYKQRRPTTTSPYVGYFDEMSSPFYSPRFEFFLRYNEKPSFAIYNRWGFSITPKFSFRGRKLRCFDMANVETTAKYTGLDKNDIPRIAQQVAQNKIAHRRITVFGLED